VSYLCYIFFALAPSIIWLLFFLRKDKHPESSKMVLIIFVLGIFISVPTAFVEMGLLNIFQKYITSAILFSLVSAFIGIALIEETAKYSVLKTKALKSSEFDEPVDVMLYMIIAALGFAAAENVLILSGSPHFEFFETATISAFRFVGATFLHALCSGALGYFIAMSFRIVKNKRKFLALGFALVIFLHGIYNLSILNIEGNQKFLIPLAVLIFLTFFVNWGFHKLKKLKSVSKINLEA
jgi:RsiW-degrading membrane proteinase PrsW (M82 family)